MNKQLPIYIAVGGGIGSSLRFAVSTILPTTYGLPIGTLTVNMIGCFLLSFLSSVFPKHRKVDPLFQKALTTGVIGSFTTFSAFSTESLKLLEDRISLGFMYIIMTAVFGLLMSWMGVKAGRKYT
ncbi:fluoride efflux transporter CrcB [Halobacillus litoralis]|uniref:fluoride efflux transporter CrcB n=1 Tax=Halobacillus litoralis TaxID=45668 RepID=UPI001CD3BFE0|nr:fluoride efflux transporter CrcB [Halobacillus litoralis]MCA0971726.1 fluoride efflux transporter CrcB [Halobacillus litoralis]